MSTAVGDEGGFAPDLPTHAAALELIIEAIGNAGYSAGQDVMLALDCAASEFYKDGEYVLESEGERFSSAEFADYLARPRRALPDRLDRGRHGRERLGRLEAAHRAARAARCSSSATISSSPTPRILREGIQQGVANAILIKVNQIGTLTETFAAIELAKRAGYGTVISHRSGETEDTTIADIAVGTNALQIKTGSLSRSDLDLGKTADDRTGFAHDCQRVERCAFEQPFSLRRQILGDVDLPPEAAGKHVALGGASDRGAGRSDPDAPAGQFALDVGNGLACRAHDKTHQFRDRPDFACQCASALGRGGDARRSPVEFSVLRYCQHRRVNSVRLAAVQALRPLPQREAERAPLP